MSFIRGFFLYLYIGHEHIYIYIIHTRNSSHFYDSTFAVSHRANVTSCIASSLSKYLQVVQYTLASPRLGYGACVTLKSTNRAPKVHCKSQRNYYIKWEFHICNLVYLQVEFLMFCITECRPMCRLLMTYETVSVKSIVSPEISGGSTKMYGLDIVSFFTMVPEICIVK